MSAAKVALLCVLVSLAVFVLLVLNLPHVLPHSTLRHNRRGVAWLLGLAARRRQDGVFVLQCRRTCRLSFAPSPPSSFFGSPSPMSHKNKSKSVNRLFLPLSLLACPGRAKKNVSRQVQATGRRRPDSRHLRRQRDCDSGSLLTAPPHCLLLRRGTPLGRQVCARLASFFARLVFL